MWVTRIKLMEVVTHNVAKLSLDWPEEKVRLVCFKLEDCSFSPCKQCYQLNALVNCGTPASWRLLDLFPLWFCWDFWLLHSMIPVFIVIHVLFSVVALSHVLHHVQCTMDIHFNNAFVAIPLEGLTFIRRSVFLKFYPWVISLTVLLSETMHRSSCM